LGSRDPGSNPGSPTKLDEKTCTPFTFSGIKKRINSEGYHEKHTWWCPMEKRRELNVVLAGLILVAVYYGFMNWIWLMWHPSQESFLNLNFLGYGLLGIVVGYTGRRSFMTSFLIGFIIGFLGTLISSVLYRDIVSMYASFVYGIMMGIGALIGVFFTKVRKRETSSS